MALVRKTGLMTMNCLLAKDCMSLVTSVMTLVRKTGMLTMDFLLAKDCMSLVRSVMTLVRKTVMLTKEFIQTLGRTSRPNPPLTKSFMQPLVTPNLLATMASASESDS